MSANDLSEERASNQRGRNPLRALKTPSHDLAFQVLLLQASDEGRGPALFGESLQRAREATPPFLVSSDFPSIYLEHPLMGDPFLDVTVLYNELDTDTRIKSPIAGEHEAMFDFFSSICREYDGTCCGFELDTKEPAPPTAAIHFQPRKNLEIVRPFCEAVGEPERADLYLDLAAHMPKSWPLSFFGMFRGRPGSPLRVCGYLDDGEKYECAANPDQLSAAFDSIGFSAYDDAMLSQISTLMAAAPGTVDFQFDVYPDATIGPVFAIDVQFGIEQPEAVYATFEDGAGADVMGLLERWGAADSRWKTAIQSAFARALPVERGEGEIGRFAFTLMPQWTKIRWIDGALQPAKLYHLAHAGLLETPKAAGDRAEQPKVSPEAQGNAKKRE